MFKLKPLIYRLNYVGARAPEDLQQNLKVLFGWAKLQMPKIFYIRIEHSNACIVKLVGSPSEFGALNYTLFISEKALSVFKSSELDALLRREIGRVKLNYLNKGIVTQIGSMGIAVAISYLISIPIQIQLTAVSRMQIVFIVSVSIYWWLMKSMARAVENILDIYAVAKLGASKTILYGALKKLTWEKGEILTQSNRLDLFMPFKSSLSLYDRAKIIFKKEWSSSEVIKTKYVEAYNTSWLSLFGLLFGLIGIVLVSWPKENQFLWAVLQKNYPRQERLVKKGLSVSSNYYRALGISPLDLEDKSSSRYPWLAAQTKEMSQVHSLVKKSQDTKERIPAGK